MTTLSRYLGSLNIFSVFLFSMWTAEDGLELSKIQKVKVLRNDRRQGKNAVNESCLKLTHLIGGFFYYEPADYK